MKKMMIACCMLLGTVAASAQFTVYQSAEVPQRSYTPSIGYGVPFTIYELIPSNTEQCISNNGQQGPDHVGYGTQSFRHRRRS